MLISAVVVTFEPAEFEPLLALLELEPRVVVASPVNGRLPLVLETESAEESVAVFEALRELPGVLSADVVAVDLGEASGGPNFVEEESCP